MLGMFAPVVGMMGVMRAGEAIKLLASLNEAGGVARIPVGGGCLLDGRTWRWTELRARRNPDCPVCGEITTPGLDRSIPRVKPFHGAAYCQYSAVRAQNSAGRLPHEQPQRAART